MTQSAKNSNFHHTDKKDMEDLEKRKTIESFTLMDDIFMRLVFEEKSCTEYVLQVLMNKKSLKVKKQYVQKDLPNLYGHSLLLDCFCEDDQGNLYNIEIQNSSHDAGPKRARYHAGLLDIHYLGKGEDFAHLPESYIIFITDKDIFKAKKQLYHIERKIEEIGADFQDGSHILYFNTDCKQDNTLGNLAKDFHRENPEEMQSKILSKRVALLKSRRLDKKGEQKMNLVLEQYRQKAFREGIEEGMEKGMEKGVESGKQRMALLMGILAEKGRVEDIKKAAGDKLYLESLLSEFGL